jgi:hypothetical protein
MYNDEDDVKALIVDNGSGICKGWLVIDFFFTAVTSHVFAIFSEQLVSLEMTLRGVSLLP